MGVVKLKNEKKLLTFFIISTIIVFVLSAVFLYLSIQKDELGGSFISAMLLFISGYGLIVFVMRAVRYKFITKLQKLVLEEKITTIAALAETTGKNENKIIEESQFLINNGYLGEYEIIGGELINIEQVRLNQAKAVVKKEVASEKASLNSAQKEGKRQKKITSEKCPNCGAKASFNDGTSTCPYCGNTLTKE